jgi:hypothetical protein
VRSGAGEDVIGVGRMRPGKRAALPRKAAARAARGQWSRAFRLIGPTSPAEFMAQLAAWLTASGTDPDQAWDTLVRVLDALAWTSETWATLRQEAGNMRSCAERP